LQSVTPLALASRQALAEGRVRRGWLGAGLRTAEFSQGGGILKGGATINNVVPGSPADIYGLKIDDIILNINDEAIRNSTEAALGMRYDQLGIYVESVSPNGQGALAGIQANAVLMQMDGRDIPSAIAFDNMILTAQAAGQTETIILLREPDGRENMVVLAIPLG